MKKPNLWHINLWLDQTLNTVLHSEHHTLRNLKKTRKCTKRAARYVTHSYRNTSSVSNMLHRLNWSALYHRRNTCKLSVLYENTHHLTATGKNMFMYLVPQTTTITSKY